jgi:threonylcarbamoyladenosine tRNA methylthiotransferase MtaB
VTDSALRVAVRTLGCKVNRTESEALAEELLGSGVELVDDEDAADVVVVNTCTVTGEADAKARKAIRQALRAALEPIVVVTGCLAALDPSGLQGLSTRVVAEADKRRVAARVIAAAAGRGGPPRVLQAGGAAERRGVPGRSLSERRTPSARGSAAGFRTRATVKVQDGCDHRCTYCIVPDARGNPVSVPAADVVARVAALRAAGTREVVLTGINIGRYADAPEVPDFAALVQAVAGTGVERIRISSIEPLDLTDDLVAALADTPAAMPHLHVPLQSGCDRTLDAMRRGYTAAHYANALRRARVALPGLAVTTDVIVGFPGETEADFAESLAFVEGCGFVKLHVFRYSARPGTQAVGMPGRLDPRESAARAKAMRALGERLATGHAHARVGGRASVLVERVDGFVAAGTSEDYLHITVRLPDPGERPHVGDVLSVIVTAAERGSAWGVLA